MLLHLDTDVGGDPDDVCARHVLTLAGRTDFHPQVTAGAQHAATPARRRPKRRLRRWPTASPRAR